MSKFGETIHDGKNYRFTMNSRNSFDKIHGNIGPNCRRYLQWLKQPGRMQLFAFVALTNITSAYVILDYCPGIGNLEIGSKSMKAFLDTLMSSTMRQLEN